MPSIASELRSLPAAPGGYSRQANAESAIATLSRGAAFTDAVTLAQ